MAGEIQLNSTTMATESSGSITVEVDTIRPNTTNGSLTLQGDSSDAGVTGLTIDSSGNATFAGTAKSDTIKPKTTDASLTLQGDSSGSGVTGITIDSSGVVNTTTAKVTNIQATSGQSLTIKDEDGNAVITIGTDNTAASYLSLNFGSYHGDSGGAGSGGLSANILDDYEEGTWTATYDSATNTGVYRKIGSVVYCQVTLNANGKSFTSITGMPFSNITGVNSELASASIGRVLGTNQSLSTLTFLQSGTSLLVYNGSGAAQTLTTNVSGTVRVDISVTYITS